MPPRNCKISQMNINDDLFFWSFEFWVWNLKHIRRLPAQSPQKDCRKHCAHWTVQHEELPISTQERLSKSFGAWHFEASRSGQHWPWPWPLPWLLLWDVVWALDHCCLWFWVQLSQPSAQMALHNVLEKLFVFLHWHWCQNVSLHWLIDQEYQPGASFQRQGIRGPRCHATWIQNSHD